MEHIEHPRNGFSVIELIVATCIFVVTVALALAGLTYAMKGTKQSDVQAELDMDVQVAMERLKRDLRLSALDRMVFYPGEFPPFKAISFPMTGDLNDDGAADVDGDGNIVWHYQYVYHVWRSQPYQLRLTVFKNRQDLTIAQRTNQLATVVSDGHGRNTHNGTNASTKVIFSNLFDWDITPIGSVFDAYSATMARAVNAQLGSIVLTGGVHRFKFEAVGTSGSDYKIGIDSLKVSSSYSEREGEAQWPPAVQAGAAATREYLSCWSGNYHLLFPADNKGDWFALDLANDRWEETNFTMPGETHDCTTVNFDETLSPKDYVVQLKGCETNWMASAQTAATNAGPAAIDHLRGCAVRVLLRGEEMIDGNWIDFDGDRSKVRFKAGAGSLQILHAFIARCASRTNATPDAVAGTVSRLTFSGANGVTLVAGAETWSDLLTYPVAVTNSYLVSFLVKDDAAHGNAWQWPQGDTISAPESYIIPQSSSPGEADTASTSWSSRGDVFATNKLYSVQCLYTTYPMGGLYVSGIFDTQIEAPQYSSVNWDAGTPWGTTFAIQFRSGNSNDLSDASAWAGVPVGTVPGTNRYVQFRAGFLASADRLKTPLLKSVTVAWPGETRVVDIGGTFTKGPDYGVFKLTVDGRDLNTGIRVDLEIFKDVRGYYSGKKRMISSLTSEVRPRNTGL